MWVPEGWRGGWAVRVGPVFVPWGRGWCPWPLLGEVGAWSVSSAPYGRRGGVAGPVGPGWQLRVVAGPLGIGWLPWGRGRCCGFRMAAVGAWPVFWVPYGRRGGVPSPMDPVLPPWGRG